jgi:hypothetical protein
MEEEEGSKGDTEDSLEISTRSRRERQLRDQIYCCWRERQKVENKGDQGHEAG